MVAIRVLAALALIMAALIMAALGAAGSAVACPAGYVTCGPACCPGK